MMLGKLVGTRKEDCRCLRVGHGSWLLGVDVESACWGGCCVDVRILHFFLSVLGEEISRQILGGKKHVAFMSDWDERGLCGWWKN